MADESVEQSSQFEKVLLFSIGKHLFCTDLLKVKEVLRSIPWSPIPLAPKHVLGNITVHEHMVTLIDLVSLMAVPSEIAVEERTIMILAKPLDSLGVVVDTVRAVADVKPEQISEVGDIEHFLGRSVMDAVIKQNGELIPMLNFQKLLEVKGLESLTQEKAAKQA